MHLFSGSSHPELAQALAKELHIPLGSITLKAFSCGERYVKFDESIRGKSVYLLQTGGKTPNEDLMELFLMCQAAKLSFAKSVHVVLPHFPYARQDRVAEPRESISAKLVANLLETAGADHVITLDLHSPQIQGFFSIELCCTAAPVCSSWVTVSGGTPAACSTSTVCCPRRGGSVGRAPMPSNFKGASGMTSLPI